MQNTFITATLIALLGACAPHVGDAEDGDNDNNNMGAADAGAGTDDDPDAGAVTEVECLETDLGDLGAVTEGDTEWFDNATVIGLVAGDALYVSIEFFKEATEDFATKYPPGTYQISAGAYAECDVCVWVASLESPLAYLAQTGTIEITSIDPEGRVVGSVTGLSLAQFDLVASEGFISKETTLKADGCETQISAVSFDVPSVAGEQL